MRYLIDGHLPFPPPLSPELADEATSQADYHPTPAILVRIAVRALVSCRANSRRYPKPILSALDRRVRDGCPTAIAVRDLIARNGLAPPIADDAELSATEMAR